MKNVKLCPFVEAVTRPNRTVQAWNVTTFGINILDESQYEIADSSVSVLKEILRAVYLFFIFYRPIC